MSFYSYAVRGNDVRREISDLRHFADAGEVSNDIAQSRQCKTKFLVRNKGESLSATQFSEL